MSAPTRVWETSATYFHAVVLALEDLGHKAGVRALAPPAVQELIDHPQSRGWWSAEVSIELTRTLERYGGWELVQKVAKSASLGSLGRLIKPLVSVLVAISGTSPATLMARSGQLLTVAVRNVPSEWSTTSPTSGTFVVRYPTPVDRIYGAWWVGGLELIFDMTRCVGTTRLVSHEGGTLVFELRWT